MNTLRTTGLPLLIGVLTLSFIGACSDDTRPVERQVVEEIDPTRTIAPPQFDDAGNELPPAEVYGRILVVSGDPEKTTHLEGVAELAVLLLDSNGDPLEGERIEYAIIDEDPGTAGLSTRRTNTDENGHATVDFLGGTDIRDYTIEVWHPDTRRLQFTVHVVDLPSGGIELNFAYEGPVPLGRLEVYLLDDPDFCEDPYYLAPPEEVIRSGNVAGVFENFVVEPLLAGTRVSILVRGRLESNGVLAAGGCVGDIEVRIDERRRVEVPVFLLPLNTAGTYTVENHFDFSDAIPGTLGDVIRGLVQFFGDQDTDREVASLIFDLVEGLVREAAGAIGGLIVSAVRGWVEDDLNEIINEYIDNDGPDWLRDFFLIGADLVSVVSRMEVVSKIRISKPRRDGTFEGSQNWVGVGFRWRLPCQDDPDPECGHYQFTMDQLVAGADGIDLVFGQFTGRVHSYNRGIIDSHTMDLQYGRLIIFVLNHIILPAIADGANNLRDGLLNLANCPSFASGITGGRDHLRLAGINIVSRDRIEGWCTSILGVVGDAAEAIIGRLRIDTHLTLQGELIFLEESDDLVADAMEDGVWSGIIRTASDEGPPFDGSFSGTRDE